MREFIIIIYLAFTQAQRLGHHFGQGGSHNALEGRYRHRGNSGRTTTAPLSNTHRVESRLNNGRSGYTPDSLQEGTPTGPIETLYNKEFFSYEAPEDDFKDVEAAQHLASAVRKNLRVVFIKAPESNALTNAAIQLAKQNVESKTAIYVLTKVPYLPELVNQLQTIQPSQESKPTVHFVKYRTAEEAVRAQQIIQREHDALGGISRVINESVSPVLDFSSKTEPLLTTSTGNKFSVRPINRVARMLNTYLPSKSRQ